MFFRVFFSRECHPIRSGRLTPVVPDRKLATLFGGCGTLSVVIPNRRTAAKAGIYWNFAPCSSMDSRLRGNDEASNRKIGIRTVLAENPEKGYKLKRGLIGHKQDRPAGPTFCFLYSLCWCVAVRGSTLLINGTVNTSLPSLNETSTCGGTFGDRPFKLCPL